MDETSGGLVCEDSEERPADGDGGGQVAFGSRKGISGGSSFEEEPDGNELRAQRNMENNVQGKED